MNKKIIILRSNPVNPDSRVEKEASTLSKAGYDVTIIAWDRASNHKPIMERVLCAGSSLPIIRMGFKASYGAGMKSIIPFLKFQFCVRRWIKKNRCSFTY